MKLWYLTRSYLPERSGGVLMRVAQVERLKRDFEVEVVHPSSDGKPHQVGHVHSVPAPGAFVPGRVLKAFEKLGILEDYLDLWADAAYRYLESRVGPDDIVFASTGGEIANLKVGARLKSRVGCKLVLNYRDPIAYATYRGLVEDQKFHVVRDLLELRYLSSCDLIFTSSRLFAEALRDKYEFLRPIIQVNHFGFPKRVELPNRIGPPTEPWTIVYAGIFTEQQAPELLYEAYRSMGGDARARFRIIYIGDYQRYAPVARICDSGVLHQPYMPQAELQKLLLEQAAFGFLSLSSEYLGYCVPSKIYEYINSGLPMVGLLPRGDALDWIECLGLGLGFRFDQSRALGQALSRLTPESFVEYRKNVLKIRERFDMDALHQSMREPLMQLASSRPIVLTDPNGDTKI